MLSEANNSTQANKSPNSNCFSCSGIAKMCQRCDTFYDDKNSSGNCVYKTVANNDLKKHQQGCSQISLSAMLDEYLRTRHNNLNTEYNQQKPFFD